MKKKISEQIFRSIYIMIILFAIQSGSASDYPDFVGYVNDYAHLLSAPQASALNQELRDFDNRTTIEVAVVTVNSIGSENPQDYAVNLANYWGVGKRDKNNGIIFLIAMQSHDIWIEAGTGLSSQFSDSQIQKIVDSVVIPQFRASRPDLGVINGVHSIVSHFGGSSTSQNAPISASSSRNVDIGNPNFFKLAASFLLLLLLGSLSVFGITLRSQTKRNSAKINDLRKLFNDLVDKEAAAIESLKELKANYTQSVWKSSEDAFNLVDHEKLELDLLGAERICNRGLISAHAAQSQLNELESSFEKAQKNVDAPINKLAEAKSAQQECAAILAGLDAVFLQAEKETTEGQISMTTRMNMETARHSYQEALSLSKQPPNAVDWIVLLDKLAKVREAVEQVSKDTVRDRAIAEKIQGQDPNEMLAKMKKTLEEAEKNLGTSYAARPDIEAAKAEYERARRLSGQMTTVPVNQRTAIPIDLYLINTSINDNIERGHRHRMEEIERSRQATERATAAHHTGFGSSGSNSFGGGRMGGGSHGGGSHGGGRMGGGSHGGGKW